MKDGARRKCKASGLKKLTDYRELLSIPKSITHLNWKAERGRDYQRQEITPRSIQVIQPGECAPMFVGVHLYLPLGRVTCRKVRRFSLYLLSLAILCAERQERALSFVSPYKPTEKVALPSR